MNRSFSTTSASRMLRAAAVIGVMGVCANVSVAAARALLMSQPAAPAAASVARANPFILALETAPDAKAETGKEECREVVVETDEGYGVRGTVTRIVCRKVL